MILVVAVVSGGPGAFLLGSFYSVGMGANAKHHYGGKRRAIYNGSRRVAGILLDVHLHGEYLIRPHVSPAVRGVAEA